MACLENIVSERHAFGRMDAAGRLCLNQHLVSAAVQRDHDLAPPRFVGRLRSDVSLAQSSCVVLPAPVRRAENCSKRTWHEGVSLLVSNDKSVSLWLARFKLRADAYMYGRAVSV